MTPTESLVGSRPATRAAAHEMSIIARLWRTSPVLVLLALAAPAAGQLDERCLVSMSGHSVRAEPGGGFHIRNVPVWPVLRRVMAACLHDDGRTFHGQSELVELAADSIAFVDEMPLSLLPPVGVLHLSAALEPELLGSLGATARMRVTAQLADGSSAEATEREAGTAYRSSNPAVATVDEQGRVTAVGRGTALVSAFNDGAAAAARVVVWPGDPHTTVEGLVRLPSGQSAAGALVSVAGPGGSAVTHPDGSFAIPGVLALPGGWLGVAVESVSGAETLFGRALDLEPIPGGFTDAGTIVLQELCALELADLADAALVRAMIAFPGPTGVPELHAAGTFTGLQPAGVARRSGGAWHPLGGAFDDAVLALAVHDAGGGPELYAGGEMRTAGGQAARGVARWDGSGWMPLGSGTNGAVRALLSHDDGSGAALYAGGDFTQAGGQASSYVARWDGSAWTPLGSGTNGPVTALAVYDDGRGAALYAAGGFTLAGSTAAASIARWDGRGWEALGSGIAGAVYALAVHEGARGAALAAGGELTQAGGQAAGNVASWDGTGWMALGSGTDGAVTALLQHDDGRLPALYAAGAFTAAGGGKAAGAARWDGSAWSALEPGTSGGVLALARLENETGHELYGSRLLSVTRWHRPAQCSR
jgi:hypothetical protein